MKFSAPLGPLANVIRERRIELKLLLSALSRQL